MTTEKGPSGTCSSASILQSERRKSSSLSGRGRLQGGRGGGHSGERGRVSNKTGDTRGRVDPTEETHARALDYMEPEHTDVHHRGSRLMELLQDVVVALLNVMLLGMGFVFLYRGWMEIVAFGNLQEGLSDIIFVVITVELYRLSVHYLKYHRVDLNILIEVGVSAIIQKVILVGVDKFTMQRSPCSS